MKQLIKGWRADASYFYIAKAFVRDEIDVDILEELMMLDFEKRNKKLLLLEPLECQGKLR